jgi:hypothetical protein
MPKGDMSKRIAAKTFSAQGLLDKTNTFKMATPHAVPSSEGILANDPTSKIDDIRCFPIDPGFSVDTWIAGANVVPGDPRVVHHVIVYVDPNGEGAAKVKPGEDGYECFGGPGTSSPSLLLAWAPGVPPWHYGEDAGIRVPKNAKLVMQVHYHPHPTISTTDQTGFELKVLPQGSPPSFVSTIILAGNADTNNPKALIHLVPPSTDQFLIPANVKGHVEAMEVTIPKSYNGGTLPPMSILAAASHMHWAGVDLKIEIKRANPSDGQPENECLLGTPKYNFNWQRPYVYDEPLDKLPLVSPGDTIRFTCTYDNTMDNPNVKKALAETGKPSPVDIHLGETTLDEMCLGAIVVVRRATVLDTF